MQNSVKVMTFCGLYFWVCYTGANEQPKDTETRLEVIEVTSQKVVQNIQDVPVSVTAISGSLIAEHAIDNLHELSAYVPNLTIADSLINTYIYMRGIGSGSNRAFEQSVGMFIDGVYMGRDRQYRAPFFDLARVEVLRGPQGVLLGKNTIAGALNLTTQGATAGVPASGNMAVEWVPKYRQFSISAVFDSGLTDDLGMRIAYKTQSGDGYMHNLNLDQQQPAQDEELLRLSWHWQIQDYTQARLKLERSEFKSEGTSFQMIKLQPLAPLSRHLSSAVFPDFADKFETRPDWQHSTDEQILPELRDTSTDLAVLNLEHSLQDAVLSSVTGYSGYQTLEFRDGDISPVPLVGLADQHYFEQFSQEFRFHTTADKPLNYIAGLFFQKADLALDYWADVNVDPARGLVSNLMTTLPATWFDPAAMPGLSLWELGLRPEHVNRTIAFQQDTKTSSAYLQANWQFHPLWQLVPGGRYTSERKSASRAGMLATYGSGSYRDAVPASVNTLVTARLLNIATPLAYYQADRNESTFTPSLKLLFDSTPELMFYASAERGYKAGGVNAAAEATATNQQFEQEEATGFELGMKSDSVDGRLRFNLAAFHTIFDNLQVTSWNGYGFDVGNAAEAVTRGIELDSQARLSAQWTMTAALAYLDSYYVDYLTGPCTALVIATRGVASPCDLTGKTTPYAPEWSGNVFFHYSTQWSDAIEFRSSFNFNYSSAYFLDADLDQELMQQSYLTLGARLALVSTDDSWELALVGKNLSNQAVLLAGQDIPLIAGGYAGVLAEPRNFVLQGIYRF